MKGEYPNRQVLIKWKDYPEDQNTWESWDLNEQLQNAVGAGGAPIPKELVKKSNVRELKTLL